VRFEVGVLRVGARLDLTPVTIQDVLAGVEEFARLTQQNLRPQVAAYRLLAA